MRSCRSRLPRICEAWIRIREASFFLAQQAPCNAAAIFLNKKSGESKTIFRMTFQEISWRGSSSLAWRRWWSAALKDE